jgi:hypothetical protein
MVLVKEKVDTAELGANLTGESKTLLLLSTTAKSVDGP